MASSHARAHAIASSHARAHAVAAVAHTTVHHSLHHLTVHDEVIDSILLSQSPNFLGWAAFSTPASTKTRPSTHAPSTISRPTHAISRSSAHAVARAHSIA